MPSNWLHDQVSEREMILIKDINAQDLCKGTLQGTQLSRKIGVTQQVLLISVINLSQDLISADFRFSYMYGSLHRSAIHLQCLFSFLKYKEKSDVCKHVLHVLLKYLFWYWPPISSLTFFFLQSCISTGGVTLLWRVLLEKQHSWDFIPTSHSAMVWETGSQLSAMRAQVSNHQKNTPHCLTTENLRIIIIYLFIKKKKTTTIFLQSNWREIDRWASMMGEIFIDWSEGLKWQLIRAQKLVNDELLAASSGPKRSFWRAGNYFMLLLMTSAMRPEHALSNFVDYTKLMGIGDTPHNRACNGGLSPELLHFHLHHSSKVWSTYLWKPELTVS